jgi:hypothetical protein
MTDRFQDYYGNSGSMGELGILLLICVFIMAIIVTVRNAITDAPQQKPPEPGQAPRPFPKPPGPLGGFPTDRADREFTYLERLLADFRPSDFRGGGFETAIQPFKDHLSEAIATHNSAVNKHNVEVMKFIEEVTQVIIELERKAKK